MGRTQLNVQAPGAVLAFDAMDKTNGNMFTNGGAVCALIAVTDTDAAYIARFKAQTAVGPDAHLPHRDVPLAASGADTTKFVSVELLDRYYFNTQAGMVEIDWLDADGTSIGGTPDLKIALFRATNV